MIPICPSVQTQGPKRLVRGDKPRRRERYAGVSGPAAPGAGRGWVGGGRCVKAKAGMRPGGKGNRWAGAVAAGEKMVVCGNGPVKRQGGAVARAGGGGRGQRTRKCRHVRQQRARRGKCRYAATPKVQMRCSGKACGARCNAGAGGGQAGGGSV